MTQQLSALPVGTIIDGEKRKYRIVKMLGQGGFGITYLAESVAKGSDFDESAIKMALKEHFISKLCSRDVTTQRVEFSEPVADEVNGSLRAFIKEAHRLKDLGVDHPNVVKIDEVFQVNNTAYYAMEYLDMGSLDEYVRSKGALTPDETKAMLQPLIGAISMLHSAKVAHYDIKPANIMLKRQWNGDLIAVLIDFGLSKHYDNSGQATSTIACAGFSAGFAPMEQYAGIRTFSPASDVYAIAATIYFCVTGKIPPEALELQPEQIRMELAPLVGDYTAAVLVHALATKTADRIPDAGALYNALFNGQNVGNQPYTGQTPPNFYQPQQPMGPPPGSYQGQMPPNSYQPPMGPPPGSYQGQMPPNSYPPQQPPMGPGYPQQPPTGYGQQPPMGPPTGPGYGQQPAEFGMPQEMAQYASGDNKKKYIIAAVVAIPAIIFGIFIMSRIVSCVQTVTHPPGMTEETTYGPVDREYASGTYYGTFDGYPITIYLQVDSDGNVEGKYCYDRIVAKKGESPENYFTIKGKYYENRHEKDGEYELTTYQYGEDEPFESMTLTRTPNDFSGSVINQRADTGTIHDIVLNQ